jgi:hypothetical protein
MSEEQQVLNLANNKVLNPIEGLMDQKKLTNAVTFISSP